MCTQKLTESQGKHPKDGDMYSYLLVPIIRMAAAFWTCWSFYNDLKSRLTEKGLQTFRILLTHEPLLLSISYPGRDTAGQSIEVEKRHS